MQSKLFVGSGHAHRLIADWYSEYILYHHPLHQFLLNPHPLHHYCHCALVTFVYPIKELSRCAKFLPRKSGQFNRPTYS